MIRIILTLMFIISAGCLQTRSQLAGSGETVATAPADQPGSGRFVTGKVDQKQRAQIDSRFYEIDRDFRQLYGKIEVIENRLSQMTSSQNEKPSGDAAVDSEKVKALESRISTLEEALLSLDKKISSRGKTSAIDLKQQKATGGGKPKGAYSLGEYYFTRKDYANAIQAYEQYRKLFPKGRRYSQATFKMGECFRRLKMPRDAKPFYLEVVERFPKTKVAKAAQTRLKSI